MTDDGLIYSVLEEATNRWKNDILYIWRVKLMMNWLEERTEAERGRERKERRERGRACRALLCSCWLVG